MKTFGNIERRKCKFKVEKYTNKWTEGQTDAFLYFLFFFLFIILRFPSPALGNPNANAFDSEKFCIKVLREQLKQIIHKMMELLKILVLS